MSPMKSKKHTKIAVPKSAKPKKRASKKSQQFPKKAAKCPTVSKESAVREAAPAYGKPPKLRFIDLFCGIGGFRIGFERAGCQCVFSSDWDKYSQLTYKANFGEEPKGDIHAVDIADIPSHDILCGGFPCQPFSLAGV